MYVGQAIRRREDERFLRGRGQFVEDITLDQPIAHAAFVRSPHAHAAVTHVETAQAAAMPGVLAVLTGADWTAAGHGEAEGVWPVKDMSGADSRTAYRPLICVDGVVRCVGEIVAMVVAEDRHQALDAAEAIEVDYEEKPANTITARALDPDTPLVHSAFGTNEVMVTEHGPEGGDRGGAHERPSRDRGRGAHQPRHRRLDGAPRLSRPLRPGQRPLHGVDHQPGAAHRAPLLHQVAAHSRAQAAG